VAAANFSRDVLEEPGDLIDFEAVIETPVYEEDFKIRWFNYKKNQNRKSEKKNVMTAAG